MTDFNKIPQGPHFAIVTQASVHIPGDERSRTNPGHGYPAETHYYLNYEAFTNRASWLRKIEEYENPRYGSREEYRAFEVNPVKVERTVTIKTKASGEN
jgi:hypothetical protein